MKFQTYGPLSLKEWSPRAVDDLYEEMDEIDPHLRYGIGTYIVVDTAGGKFVPWYVGKTQNSFGSRLKQQFDGAPFEAASKKCKNFSIFLLARVTPKGRIIQKKGKALKSIDRLELALIGTCLSQNPELLNKQEKAYHLNIYVPGYLNSPASERNVAAKKLAKCLGTKSGK